jgi:hypothetical protein
VDTGRAGGKHRCKGVTGAISELATRLCPLSHTPSHSVQGLRNGLVVSGRIAVWRSGNGDTDHRDIEKQQTDRDDFLPPGQFGPDQFPSSPGSF